MKDSPTPRIIPYHRYWFEQAEIEAVTNVLKSGWLTTGAQVAAFEKAFAHFKQASVAVGVTSCTAALSVALASLDPEPDSEVITTPVSFVATSNIILQNHCKIVYADIDPLTMNLDPAKVEACITPKTKAIVLVHIAGHPCDMDAFMEISRKYQIPIIEDCAHAIEASWKGKPTGTMGYAGAFSFYPNKNMTTGEGGMVISNHPETDAKFRLWRSHGLNYDSFQRSENKYFRQYDVVAPGFKFNMNEIQAALGLCQLARISEMRRRRLEIVRQYQAGFAGNPWFRLLEPHPDSDSAWHLAIVKFDPETIRLSRDKLMEAITARGVQLSLSFKPIHLFSYFQKLGFRKGSLPVAETMTESIFSLPLYPLLTDDEVEYVIETVLSVMKESEK